MSVPGAENPEKVRNIVRGEGALEGFRAMYGSLLEGTEVEGYEWKGDGEEMMTVSTSQTCAGKRRESTERQQPTSTDYLADLLLTLPSRLLHPIARHYRPTIVGSLVSPSVREERQNETIKRSEVPTDKEFWVKVASQERIREVVLNGQSISIEPSLFYATLGHEAMPELIIRT